MFQTVQDLSSHSSIFKSSLPILFQITPKMKLSIIALLGLAASTVSAQDYKVTKPFTLKVSYFGDRYDAGINSSYIRACHAGAATKALCLSANSDPSAASTFTLNYTDYTFVQGFASGPLVYFLQGSGLNVSLGMTFNCESTWPCAFMPLMS